MRKRPFRGFDVDFVLLLNVGLIGKINPLFVAILTIDTVLHEDDALL
jgi:hypothetical protein